MYSRAHGINYFSKYSFDSKISAYVADHVYAPDISQNIALVVNYLHNYVELMESNISQNSAFITRYLSVCQTMCTL